MGIPAILNPDRARCLGSVCEPPPKIGTIHNKITCGKPLKPLHSKAANPPTQFRCLRPIARPLATVTTYPGIPPCNFSQIRVTIAIEQSSAQKPGVLEGFDFLRLLLVDLLGMAKGESGMSGIRDLVCRGSCWTSSVQRPNVVPPS